MVEPDSPELHMIWLILAAYFALAMLAISWWLLPSWRHWCWRLAQRGAQWAADLFFLRWLRMARDAEHVVAATGETASVVAARSWISMRKHWMWWGAAAAIVVLPAALALSFGGLHQLDSFSDDRRPVNDHVQALLNGEQLVPPPPLPPDVFTTRDVELVRPNLGNASRDWGLLDPDFRQRLLSVLRVMRDHYGYELVMIEGYRSPERQDMLASIGTHVTNAGAYQSYHQYGLAADIAFMRGGRLVLSEKDPWAMQGYELFGQVAEAAGLTWGGRWKLLDFGHVELRRDRVLKSSR
jgi:peptidoglycan LD-endopeptidase CwlK